MKVVNIFRAEGVLREDAVEQVTINIHEPVPATLAHGQARAFHASEGAALADAIWSSCPGGTVDALIVALMSRRASLLRVTLPRGEADHG